jgi:hypothetical protein
MIRLLNINNLPFNYFYINYNKIRNMKNEDYYSYTKTYKHSIHIEPPKYQNLNLMACAKLADYVIHEKIIERKNCLLPKTKENRLKLNILYYDESLLKDMDLSNYCAYIQMNIAGTFYGCHKMSLFNLVCEKIKMSDRQFILITSGSSAEKIYNKISNIGNIREYYILCSGNEKKSSYNHLAYKFSKLKGIYENEEDLDKKLSWIPSTKINEDIKSSNLIYFRDYIKIYVKLHFEIIRKYILYKLLKQNNYNEDKFLSKVESEHPKLLEIAKQLFPKRSELNDFFKKKVPNESPKIIDEMLNKPDNVQNYINNYTAESFYYRNLNLFLRTGDFDSFRTLSSHISRFIYYLYEFREKNPKNYNLYLYRRMLISENDFRNYQKSINDVICFPSFTSTSSDKGGFYTNCNVMLIIDSNYSKSVVSIEDLSVYQHEKEYLFLPFSFFRIKSVYRKSGTSSDPHIINLIALNSDKPIEEMFYYFFNKYTDSLDPEGLDILKIDGNSIYFNSQYYSI